MEILQTAAKMQQSQMGTPKTVQTQAAQSVQEIQKAQIVQEKAEQRNDQPKASNADYEKQMEKLVMELNSSLNPFNTSLRFGFDNSSEDFYVSVIDTKTNDMVRRFPAEEAQLILPKIQEINGLLFDRTV